MKKNYRPRVRVRSNSDSKNYKNKIVTIKKKVTDRGYRLGIIVIVKKYIYTKLIRNSTRAKLSARAKVTLCAKMSSWNFIPSCKKVFVQKYLRAILYVGANLTATGIW